MVCGKATAVLISTQLPWSRNTAPLVALGLKKHSSKITRKLERFIWKAAYQNVHAEVGVRRAVGAAALERRQHLRAAVLLEAAGTAAAGLELQLVRLRLCRLFQKGACGKAAEACGEQPGVLDACPALTKMLSFSSRLCISARCCRAATAPKDSRAVTRNRPCSNQTAAHLWSAAGGSNGPCSRAAAVAPLP